MEFVKGAIYNNFIEWVGRFNEKTFDLNAPKEVVTEEFYERFLSGYYKTLNDFAMSILKSYVIFDENAIVDFVSPEDLTIKRPLKLINKFLNDYILEQKVECQNKNEIVSVIADTIFDDTKKTFGNVIYLEMVSPKFKTIPGVKSAVVNLYKTQGFIPYSRDNRFLFGKGNDATIPTSARRQKRLLDTYNFVADEYIKNYKLQINKNLTEEQYNNLWSVVKACLNSIESRMTEATKQDTKFIASKKLAGDFFENKQEGVRRSITRAGRHGDYYLQVKESLKNYSSGKYSEEDVQNLGEFYERLRVLKKALSIKDSKNKNYPTNYFVCMPIHPLTAIDLISKFQRSGFLTQEQEANVVSAKSLIRGCFSSPYMSNGGDVADPKEVLLSYKHKTVFPDGTVKDYTGDENYSKFVSQVDSYIEAHHLPKYAECIACVGQDLFRGREPINMGKEETKKDVAPVL